MSARQRGGRVPRSRLLPAADRQLPDRRAPLLEAVTRVIHPTVLVVVVYLLFVGLHEPGGGFSAGLVAGLGLMLRYLAGGPAELGVAAPFPPGVLLGAGLVVVAGYGAAGVALTGEFLGGAVWKPHLGPLGEVEIATSLVFEVGIVLIVVGLVVDVLRTLGAAERPGERADHAGGGGAE